MAQKITSKNLSYDDSLPPFLARLRNQHAASAAEPDPILASHRRAAKPRSASEEAEDGPLVVDEDGVTVRGVTVGKDGVVTEEERDEGQGEGVNKVGEADGGKEDKVAAAAIGGGRKRKVGKVVGGDDDDDEDQEDSGEKATGKDRATTKAKVDDDKSKGSSKGRKKAKKIKLSFGDEDGD